MEFDDAHFDFVGEASGFAVFVETRDFEIFLAMIDDSFGYIEDFDVFVADVHVFESAGPIFGGEEVIAVFVEKPFANVFEAVAESPADADGFFCEDERALFLGVEVIFGVDPTELVGSEDAAEDGGAVDSDGGKDDGHRSFLVSGVGLGL